MTTTIQIAESTRLRLKAQKVGGETYDDEINRILNELTTKKSRAMNSRPISQ